MTISRDIRHMTPQQGHPRICLCRRMNPLAPPGRVNPASARSKSGIATGDRVSPSRHSLDRRTLPFCQAPRWACLGARREGRRRLGIKDAASIAMGSSFARSLFLCPGAAGRAPRSRLRRDSVYPREGGRLSLKVGASACLTRRA